MTTNARLAVVLCLLIGVCTLAAFFGSRSRHADPVLGGPTQVPELELPDESSITAQTNSVGGSQDRAPLVPAPAALQNIITSLALPGSNLPLCTGVEGRCVNSSGEGVSSARVAIVHKAAGKRTQPIAETICDAEGRFVFSDLEPFETYTLCAIAPGHPYASLDSNPGEQPVLEFEDGCTILGQVSDANTGASLSGVSIRDVTRPFPYQPSLSQWLIDYLPAIEATSDADGRFELTGARSNKIFRLGATLDGYIAHQKQITVDPESIPASIASNSYLTSVELRPGRKVEFEVVDWKTRQPIANAEVSAGLMFSPVMRTTDRSGKFDWTISTGTSSKSLWGRVRADGYCVMQIDFDAAGQATANPRVLMVPEAKIVGRVVNSEGAALPGATLRLFSERPRAPAAVSDLPSWQSFYIYSLGVSFALSNGNGYYEFEGVIPREEPRTLSASHSYFYCPEGISLIAATPGGTTNHDLALQKGGVIQGRVTLLGEDFPARLKLRGPNKAERHAQADSNGIYQVQGLRPGLWAVTFSRSAKTTAGSSPPRRVIAGQVLCWDSELYPLGTQLYSGRVLYSDGVPIAKTEVFAHPSKNSAYSEASCTSDANGFFELELPVEPDKGWQFNCRVHGYIDHSAVHTDNTQFIKLEIPRLGKVGLRLIEFGSGQTLPLETLRWRKSDSTRWTQLRSQVIEEDIIWVHLPVGLVDFCASSKSSRHFDGILSNIEVSSDHEQTWDLTLEKGILLKIQFVSADGKPELPFFGQPAVKLLESENTNYGNTEAHGVIRYTPLKSGPIAIGEDRAVAFEPALLELGFDLEQERQVTWRITDIALYEQLSEEYRLLQDSLQAFGCYY